MSTATERSNKRTELLSLSRAVQCQCNRCVDIRDGRQEDVKVFIKKRNWNGIECTRLGACIVDYF